MEIRLLRYFLAVAREESITRAAAQLHISQPSLSKQMMELEEKTGRQLLIRGKRRIGLTQDGILLRRRAEEILALVEKTEQELRTDDEALCGEIAIGGDPTPSVLDAAAALRRHCPEIRFRFYTGDAADVTERLEHGSLDFAVLLEPVDPVRYEFLPLEGVTHWGLLLPEEASPAQKPVIEKGDIPGLPLILHQRPGLQREFARWAEMKIEELNIAAAYNIIHGDPAAYVQSGLGYLLTTDGHLPEPLSPGLCFRPLSPALELRYVLVWKQYGTLSRAAERFLREIQARGPAFPGNKR